MKNPAPLLERFWSKVQQADGCWMWQGGASNRGYGRIVGAGKAYAAHRYMWAITNGPIPPGLFVCHHCDVRGCVNPAHLFLGTHDDNMRDMDSKGRRRIWNLDVTHCKHGHDLAVVGTYSQTRTVRGKAVTSLSCRACNRTRKIEYKQRLRDRKLLRHELSPLDRQRESAGLTSSEGAED